MEVRHLKLIKAIVEEGSINNAINKLHLTQSALSHQLKEVEHKLGTLLFKRQNRKLIVTDAGKRLYQIANEILDKIEHTEREIKMMSLKDIGEIKVAASCYSSYHWLPSVMKQFHSLYPKVDVNLIMEATCNPMLHLLEHRLDICITNDPVENDKIKYIELFQDEVVVIVSKNHAWAKKKNVIADDFVNEQLIIHSLPLESTSLHQHLLEPAKISPKKIIVLPLTEAAVEMVKAEIGVIAMAHWAAQPYLKDHNLKAIKIGKKGLKRKHYLAIIKNKPYPDYFHSFIEFLKVEIYMQGILPN